MINYRKEVLNLLLPGFRRDQRYYLLVGDMGFGTVDRLAGEFPHRIVNMGIMEQAAVGIAAGMSMAGLIPIFYTMVNFLAFRALEQVRNDIVLQRLNVKLVGTGANDYFRFLGLSHSCGQDDIKALELVQMKVYDPYQADIPFDQMVDEWLTSPQAGYLRV